MTFRLPSDLARELRTLPNQTDFVESALRDALGVQCPLCEGRGRVRAPSALLPNWRRANLPPLMRAQALQLKALVRLAHQLGITKMDVDASVDSEHVQLNVTLLREQEHVLEGRIRDGSTTLTWH